MFDNVYGVRQSTVTEHFHPSCMIRTTFVSKGECFVYKKGNDKTEKGKQIIGGGVCGTPPERYIEGYLRD